MKPPFLNSVFFLFLSLVLGTTAAARAGTYVAYISDSTNASIMAAWGGGPGLVSTLYRAAERAGVQILYDAWVRHLVHDDAGVSGVVATVGGTTRTYRAGAVVLACGGFEANAEWRTRYLGPGWDLAKVRGTKYNTGDGWRWRSAWAHNPTGTGRVVTRLDGNAMRRTSAIRG